MGSDHRDAAAAAEKFGRDGSVFDVRAYGNGNVHETYLVDVRRAGEGPARFLLQRVNTRVFPRPDLILRNMRTVTEHLSRRLSRCPSGEGRRWEVPRVLPARDGGDHWIDEQGSFWRSLAFIESTHSLETLCDPRQAGEIGRALGTFHALVSDLPAGRLADTLEGFHVTPLYLRHYDKVLSDCGAGGSPEVTRCHRFVAERRAGAGVLEEARHQGLLCLRTIHGDPKINNVLIDDVTGCAVCLVDLDTVKPGLVHYDIGDCLRSGCNPLGEETDRWEEVGFEPDLCQALLGGYVSGARAFLSDADREYIYAAIRLIAFELGLRFFTDYLEGNVYFRAKAPEHNLIRALVQFRLTESIERQESAIRAIVGALR